MFKMSRLSVFLMFVFLVVAFGCSEKPDNAMDKTADAVSDAAEDTVDAVNEAADSAGDAIESAKADTEALIEEKKAEIADLAEKVKNASVTEAQGLKEQLDSAKNELAELEEKLAEM